MVRNKTELQYRARGPIWCFDRSPGRRKDKRQEDKRQGDTRQGAVHRLREARGPSRAAALRNHRLEDKRPAVEDRRRVEAQDRRRAEAGQGRVVATVAAEADWPGPRVVAVVVQEAAFRSFRRTQHWTHWSRHNGCI
jgi:hypothetical protein